jgi:5-methylcytosine-specific restriction enzyme B
VLEDFLDYLNGLIRKKEGREKQIGHAVFMEGEEPVDDAEEFAKRFRYEVIPLLQEYCYEDYGALSHYLGQELVDVSEQRLRIDVIDEPDSLVATLARLVNARDIK